MTDKRIKEWVDIYKEKNIICFTFPGITTKINKDGIIKKSTPNFIKWGDINKDNYENYIIYNQNHKGMAVLTGEISGITGLDFDDVNLYNQFVHEFPILKNYYTVKTNKGYHIYIKYDNRIKTTTNLLKGLDIKNDASILYAPPTIYKLPDNTIISYTYMGGDILDLPEEIFNKLYDKDIKINQINFIKNDDSDDLKNDETDVSEITTETIKKNNIYDNNDDYEFIKEIINNGFLDKDASNYAEWFKISCILKNSFDKDISKDLFILFSKRCMNKYNESENMKIWDNINLNHHKPIKLGSLIRDIRRKNPDIKLKQQIKNNECLIKFKNDKNDNDNDNDNDNVINENETYEYIKNQFEKNHAKIINISSFVKNDKLKIHIFTKDKLKTSYEHMIIKKEIILKNGAKCLVGVPFINEWFRDPEIKIYDDVGIYPNKDKCPKNIYNLWTPFIFEEDDTPYIENKEGLDFILNHINILCNYDENIYNYIINWITQMIQYPEIKSIVITLISKEGAGKSLFIKFFKNILGYSKVFESTKPSRDVWGDFNGIMTSCFLVNLNELNVKDTLNHMEEIKGLVTDEFLPINQKGINQFSINSYHRFIITTNNENPITTKEGDRRNLIIRSSDDKIGDKEYFYKLNNYLEDVNVLKTCYYYFKNRDDMKDFYKIPIPKTEHQENLKYLNKNKIDLWLESFTADNLDKEEIKLKPAEVLELFNEWKIKEGIDYEINSLKLGVQLSQLQIKDGVINDPSKRYKIFNINVLKKHYRLGCLIKL